MYDRAHLVAVATDKGDRHYTDLATRLKVAPATAWRLWTGKTAPSARVAAAVQDEYGIPASRLLKLSEPSARAAA
ncbi:XRE family transcriptional regulator [Streptomyces sp. ND04-05B]|uniref:XRE family transcriptional regulator n=1 Tax=Streptomyces sp. ND04-05B TaxID=3028693 RepID=UPI0029A0D9F2|nr:XRE family transcriptional regulator [Streptomyces sp. ND04-05B]MDX3063392.1 XRE family transcriptional regulator [Streptomyces sp. ND04-05B]